MLKIARRTTEIYFLLFFIIVTGYRYQLLNDDLVFSGMMVLGMIALAWLFYTILKPAPFYWPDLRGSLVLFIMAVIACVFNAFYVPVALAELYLWVIAFYVCLLIYNLICYGYDEMDIYKSLLAVGVIYAMLKILQSVDNFSEITNTCNQLVASPNMAAALIVMVMILALSLYLEYRKIWPAIALTIAAIALILTGSRGGLISAAIALPAVYIIREMKQNKARYLHYLGVVILALAAAASVMFLRRPLECYPIQQQANGIEIVVESGRENAAWTSSLNWRFLMYKQAWQIMKRYPAYGAGLANFQLLATPLPNSNTPPHAHSLYFTILAERGLIGLATTLLLLAVIVYQLYTESENITTSAAAIAAILATLIHGIPDAPTKELFVIRYLMVIVAIGLAGVNNKKIAGGFSWLQREKKT